MKKDITMSRLRFSFLVKNFRVIYMKTFSCLAYIALTHKHAQMYQVTIKANANIKSRKFTKLRSKKSTDFH